MAELNHFDSEGRSRMVDVSAKEVTLREALASAVVRMQPETLARIRSGSMTKGNVFEVARLAGILASKRTGELIPLCHPLGIDAVEVLFEEMDEARLGIVAKVRVHGRTGVEMEAMTAVSVAALTIYDMCKAIDRSMEIGPIRLEEKRGGKSGHYQRESGGPADAGACGTV